MSSYNSSTWTSRLCSQIYIYIYIRTIHSWTTHPVYPLCSLFHIFFFIPSSFFSLSFSMRTRYKLLTHKPFRAYYLLRIFDVLCLFTARKSHEIYLKCRYKKRLEAGIGKIRWHPKKRTFSDKWSILWEGLCVFFFSNFTLATTEVHYFCVCLYV